MVGAAERVMARLRDDLPPPRCLQELTHMWPPPSRDRTKDRSGLAFILTIVITIAQLLTAIFQRLFAYNIASVYNNKHKANNSYLCIKSAKESIWPQAQPRAR